MTLRGSECAGDDTLGLPGSLREMISAVSWESAAQLSLIEGVGLDDS